MSVEQFIKYVDKSKTKNENMRKFIMDGHGHVKEFDSLMNRSHIRFKYGGGDDWMREAHEKLEKWLKTMDGPEWYLSVDNIMEMALIRTGVLPKKITIEKGKKIRRKTEVLTPEEVEQMIKAAELHPVPSSDIFGATQSNASEHISNADIFD